MIEDSEWSDVWLMIEDIREHARNNGRLVVSDDDPANLKLGWRCAVTGKYWRISSVNLRDTLGEGPKPDLIRGFLKDQFGKSVLTAYLNSSQY